LSKHKTDQSTSTQKAHFKTLSSTIQNMYILEKSKEEKKNKSNKELCISAVRLHGEI